MWVMGKVVEWNNDERGYVSSLTRPCGTHLLRTSIYVWKKITKLEKTALSISD